MKHLIFIIKAIFLPLYNMFESMCSVNPVYINYRELYIMHYKQLPIDKARQFLDKKYSYKGFYTANCD